MTKSTLMALGLPEIITSQYCVNNAQESVAEVAESLL